MNTPKERLDPFLTSMGLEPGEQSIRGLNYAGTVDGRQVRVHCSVRRRTRYAGEIRYTRYAGHRLVFTADTPLMTRLTLFPPDRLLLRLVASTNRFFGTQKLHEMPAALTHIDAWAAEPAWARNFLALPAVQKALTTLIPTHERPPSIGVNLRPGKVEYSVQLNLEEVTPKTTELWFNNVLTLAEQAESIPAPTKTVETTWLEDLAERSPVLLAFLILGVCMFLSFIPAACLVIISVVLASG